jgi:hypothetical protein
MQRKRIQRSSSVEAGALAGACELALVRSARAWGAGTRQQVRAAARHFVRRHRRDTAYLSWVVRSVGPGTALAAVLLGLPASPANAELAPFTVRSHAIVAWDAGAEATPAFGDLDRDGDLDLITGTQTGILDHLENTGTAVSAAFAVGANPLAGNDVGSRSTPVLGDLDGDGDLDALVGEMYGTFRFFENSGSAAAPAFVERTGAANPLDGQDVGQASAPALGDLDRDGDLDLVAGDESGSFSYFENTGSAASPEFAARTGAANPLDGLDAGIRSKPAIADLEGDGDLDLVAGDSTGSFDTFENTGSATIPSFTQRTGTADPLNGLNSGGESAAPWLGDLDGDGDPDLVVGRLDGQYRYLLNLSRDFAFRPDAANLAAQDVGNYSSPAFGDLDGDGDLDLVAGEYDGVFNYFENTGSAASAVFAPRTGASNPLSGPDIGTLSAPALGDLDGDGDLDLVAGKLDGAFAYFENTGTAIAPSFVARTGAANPLDGSDVGARSRPALGDVDGDGDRDLVVGKADGAFDYFENTGTALSAAFVQRIGASNPLNGRSVPAVSSPTLGDVDGDGDADLVSGAADGVFHFYENDGNPIAPTFLPGTGTANPLAAWGTYVFSAPALGDLDGDGDLDAISGTFTGRFYYFESFAARALSALQLSGAANPLDGEDVGTQSAPALGDLDGDGDSDLLVGLQDGTFGHLEHTGSAVEPAWIVRTGVANPLDGEDAGTSSAPALGDLDADGDLDLVVGRQDGSFAYYENAGDAEGPAFDSITGAGNPLDGQNVGLYSAPALGDLDGDGDLDVVSGAYAGTFFYYENTGSAESPAFAERTGAANPLSGLDAGIDSMPVLGDFDRDGDLDLVAGEFYGALRYFRNTGSATNPVFLALAPEMNPLDGEDVGGRSAPTAADLDGDGDLDLVTGDSGGTFIVHYFPEPARGWLLAVGVALLRWLSGRAQPRSTTSGSSRGAHIRW